VSDKLCQHRELGIISLWQLKIKLQMVTGHYCGCVWMSLSVAEHLPFCEGCTQSM
jgi:hypothetical protein